MLSDTTIKRLTLSRYLFTLASDHARLHREVAAFACINMLQDAIEIFLLAAADHLNAAIKVKTEFAQYLDLINDRLSPKELPFRRRLIEINKVRIASKHDGIRPDLTEINGYMKSARDFLDQGTVEIFQVDFWTISLVHLLDDGETKNLLDLAEKAYRDEYFSACLTECRKAFFREFESSYNLKVFDKDTIDPLDGMFSRVPYYARNKGYILENVKDPFDYILLDHSRVDSDLVKEGIDSGTFWNIWRLTPSVYRERSDTEWLVKNEIEKFDSDGLQNRAAYVLENLTDILLKKAMNFRSLKTVKRSFNYVVTLQRASVPLFRTADDKGDIVRATPEGVTQIPVVYGTPGLSGKGFYWKASGYVQIGDKREWIGGGYLREEDVESP